VAQPAPSGARLAALDVFRGATVAAMILVNNPGDWNATYAALEHAPWHGCTPTDLIFPFFLFAVGVAITLSRRARARDVLLRSLKLLGLGLFMAAFPAFDLAHSRWPGVLQRIALCYLAAWFVQRRLGPRGQVGVIAGLLLGYWAALTLVPLPDGRAPNLEVGTNLTAYVDRLLLDGHMWRQTRTWDPEGVLSTLPAIATTLMGVLTGGLLAQRRAPQDALRIMLLAGGLATSLGWAWSFVLPLNKNLWTSSYALFTGGLALLTLGLIYWLVDLRRWRAWTAPFVTFGVNAIAVFVASGLVAKLLARTRLDDGASFQQALHAAAFASWLPSRPASLAYALANVVFWYLVLRAMQARGWQWKV
jgi:predicted acyltransferase